MHRTLILYNELNAVIIIPSSRLLLLSQIVFLLHVKFRDFILNSRFCTIHFMSFPFFQTVFVHEKLFYFGCEITSNMVGQSSVPSQLE
jgi:hypothetical protein